MNDSGDRGIPQKEKATFQSCYETIQTEDKSNKSFTQNTKQWQKWTSIKKQIQPHCLVYTVYQ